MVRFVVVGHVDDGKSTLCGHLLAQVGYFDSHIIETTHAKAKEDRMFGWRWARLLDLLEEEQRHGKTQECTEISFRHHDIDMTLVDTPGHQTLIRVMVQSLFQPGLIGVVVIGADTFDKSFLRGSIREDILLLRAAGITHLVICVNKMDLVEWNQDVFISISNRINRYTSKLNFSSIKFVPISALDGIGTICRKECPEWYDGLPLLDTISKCSSDTALARSNPDLVDRLMGRLVLFSVPIVVIGLSGVAHCFDGEVDFTLDRLDNASFQKGMSSNRAIIQLQSKVRLAIGDRLILRSKDNATIGYFIVEKAKAQDG